MSRKIWYLILVLVTVYLEIMYDSTWMIPLLSLEILLAAGMLVMSWYFRRHIRVWLDMRIPVAQKKEKFAIELHVENRGLLPVPGIRVEVGYENKYGRYRERRILEQNIGSRTQKASIIRADSDYSGHIRFFLLKVTVGDYLGLFRLRMKTPSEVSVNVLPDILEIPVRVTARTLHFQAEGDDYEKERVGDDPSEIFQIRQFRPGDRMQTIHWKTSARTGQLMSKEYGSPRGCSILLLLDLQQTAADSEGVDRFLEMTMSLSFALLAAGCLHYAAWYDEKAAHMMRCAVRGEEDVYEMMDMLMSAPVYEQEYDLDAAYDSVYPEGTYSTVLKWDMDGRLMCNETVAGTFGGGESLARDLAGFVLEV